jgi:hypothetical protein
MMQEDWRRLTHEVLVRVYYKGDGQTGHGNYECENIAPGWRIRTLTVKNRRAAIPSAQGMPPKPNTPSPAALYPQVQMSSGGASELHKHQNSTSLKQGQKKRRKTKASSANTTATSPVSLASDVGHVDTQGASESREKAKAHNKKLFNSMIANPPQQHDRQSSSGGLVIMLFRHVGTEEDFCTKRPSQGSQAICPT